MQQIPHQVQIFIAYSRRDKELLKELLVHLTPLERDTTNNVKIWYDGEIMPAAVWEDEIKKHLHGADIILLLVSADSIASDYFYNKEVSDALNRHRKGDAYVVPLILRPCAWDATPLHELQALPQNGKPVTTWANRDEAFTDAVQSLRKLIDEIEANKKRAKWGNTKTPEERLTQYKDTLAEARRLQQAGRWAEARTQWRTALDLYEQGFPESRLAMEQYISTCGEALARQSEYARHCEEAERQLRRRKWAEASTAARAALQLMPGDARAQGLLEEAETGKRTSPRKAINPFPVLITIAGLLLVVWGAEKVFGESETNTTTGTEITEVPDTTEKSIEKIKTINPIIQQLEDDMVNVEGGSFTMGCKDYERDGNCYKWEIPPRLVQVTPFAIGRYEVTQAQWRAVMDTDPPKLAFKGCDNCPVERVSWNEAQEFLQKLNALTGKNYRLPSEAEWEYAARGGSQSREYRYSGSSKPDEVAWYNDNSDRKTHPVGEKNPNELGLYDMSGNVWEWCEDDQHDNYQNAPPDSRPWVDYPRGEGRILRGGSWFNNKEDLRTARRQGHNSEKRGDSGGFRIARD